MLSLQFHERTLNFMYCDRLVEEFGFPYLKSRDVISSTGERFTLERLKPHSHILPSVFHTSQYESSIFHNGANEQLHYSCTLDSPADLPILDGTNRYAIRRIIVQE